MKPLVLEKQTDGFTETVRFEQRQYTHTSQTKNGEYGQTVITITHYGYIGQTRRECIEHYRHEGFREVIACLSA